MLQVGNYKVDPRVFEILPESVAREECVLPIDLDNDALRVVIGANSEPDLRKSLSRVASFANRKVVYTVAERDPVATLVDELFTPATVSNCPVEFKVNCPLDWLRLSPTDSQTVRFCGECKKQVYFCKDEREAREHTNEGHCIAIIQVGYVDVGMATFSDSPEERP